MKKQLFVAAAAASLLAGTALAQTTSPPSSTQTKTTMTDAKAGMHDAKGITTANSASMAVRFVQVKPADMMVSSLVGLDVYNNQNEKLGEIEDIAVENGKTLTGVIVSVGGFLGMNESYVVVDPSTIVVHKQGKDNDDWKAFVNTSRDDLKNAPKFEYSAKS
jgi:sporulation protein YlmC with PRC-barrel domain